MISNYSIISLLIIKTPVLLYIGRYFTNSFCINGVIYCYNVLYGGRWDTFAGCFVLVAFDVRSESLHRIPLPPETYAKDVTNSWVLEISGQFAIINVHENKQFSVWTLETAEKSPSRWKKRSFPFPLDEEIQQAGREFFSRTSINATSSGEIVLLKLNETPSLWVLLGADSVWKKFRIEGIAEYSCEAVVAQNIAQTLFHLE
ncbi:unnamed protein product [Cuscuta epithymum]|uniref:F-box associated beta-propeller type 3 domain-containing protein n=1 Tax=Cuscuta epithymum TaxID=186058 RepID=A0AAV0DDX1_9ASTE|nr:unnamed protein product [Cuscuta epithymum]